MNFRNHSTCIVTKPQFNNDWELKLCFKSWKYAILETYNHRTFNARGTLKLLITINIYEMCSES